MNNVKLKETPQTKSLKFSINGLIDEYKRAYNLLNDQMQAVINHDIESLNRLIEKQVAAYEKLQQSEQEFKHELQSFHTGSKESQEHTLSLVLDDLDQPSHMLNTLRNQLHAQVEKTEKMRGQLMELLQFAQQQNTEIFKAICTVAADNTEGYNAKGKKQSPQTNGMAINQQA